MDVLNPNNPHYVLLGGIVTIGVFCWIEARRYRGYDLWRSRVRTLQANFFADAADPSKGVANPDWRAELSDDFRRPTPKLSERAAIAHRLRRVYLPLLTVLLGAWVVRITQYDPSASWRETAAIGPIPGVVVVAAVCAAVLGVLGLALLPGPSRVRGEIYRDERDEGTE